MDREESINEILSYYSGRKDKKEQETVAAMLRELQEACGGISPKLQERAAQALWRRGAGIWGLWLSFICFPPLLMDCRAFSG